MGFDGKKVGKYKNKNRFEFFMAEFMPVLKSSILYYFQETVQTALLGLRNYVKRLFIAARTVEDDEDRETPNEYKKRK